MINLDILLNPEPLRTTQIFWTHAGRQEQAKERDMSLATDACES